MKSSLKGALLSGLVFPGAGELWLKYYLRGIALIVVASAASALIVAKGCQEAFAILEKMETTGGTVDMMAMLDKAGAGANDSTTSHLCTLLLLCWIIGMVDAYFLGRKKDLAAQSKKKGESSRSVHA